MLPSHFITQQLPKQDGEGFAGYALTLTTRLGHMLQQAENLYGPRDLDWTLLGIEFSPDGPQIWYPPSGRHIVIQLSDEKALNDTLLACYQLAHECIHLLAPFGKKGAPVLEEGLATVFSEDYMHQTFNRINMTTHPSYQEAASKVRELLAQFPDAIRALRKFERSFRQMTPATFEQAGMGQLEPALVQALLTPFDR